MIRSPAGCARRFPRRVGRHRCRTAGLSSETRRRLIRRGSLGPAVLPGLRLPSRRGAPQQTCASAVSRQLDFLKFAAVLPRRRSALPRCVSTARPCVGEGGGRGRRCLGTSTGYRQSPEPKQQPGPAWDAQPFTQVAKSPHRLSLRRAPALRGISQSDGVPGAILFYSAARIARKLKEANFTPNSRRWI